MKNEIIIEDKGEGWKKKTFINHRTGRVFYTFLFRGRHPAPQILLKTRKAQHYLVAKLIEKDLRDAICWTEYALSSGTAKKAKTIVNNSTEGDIITKGLLKAAVINYAKAFSNDKGRMTQLQKSKLPSSLHYFHDELLNMRHEYVAHGGISEYESGQMIVAYPPRNRLHKSSKIISIRETNIRQLIWHGNNKADDLLNLIKKAHGLSVEEVIRRENLLTDELNKILPSKLYKIIGDREFVEIDDELFSKIVR